MKHQVYFGIALRIIILFIVGMIMTFIPDQLRDFFGDTLHICPVDKSIWHSCGDIDIKYNWGVRHYWYFWMMVLLFLLSLANIIIGIIKLVKKHYDL